MNRRSAPMGTLGRIAIAAWLPILVLVLIWISTILNPSPFAPPLGEVFQSLFTFWFGEGFFTDILPSLGNAAVGFLIALIAGVALGALLAAAPALEILVSPVLTFARSLPAIALLPALLILVGTGDAGRVALIAYGAIWPILLNTLDGIRAIAPEIRQTARSYRVTRANTMFRVILPGAFPQMSVGIRLSLTISLVLMVGSEFYGALHGIGVLILDSKNSLEIAEMWSGVILLGIIGYLVSVLYSAFEGWMLRWRA